MHKLFYSITIRMLHYNPRHVSSINMPIFRRPNCSITASGIVTRCKRLYSMPDESRMQSALIWHTALYCTESDDTRCSDNTICPPEDGHDDVRNMSRILMKHTYCYRIKEFVHWVGNSNKSKNMSLFQHLGRCHTKVMPFTSKHMKLEKPPHIRQLLLHFTHKRKEIRTHYSKV